MSTKHRDVTCNSTQRKHQNTPLTVTLIDLTTLPPTITASPHPALPASTNAGRSRRGAKLVRFDPNTHRPILPTIPESTYNHSRSLSSITASGLNQKSAGSSSVLAQIAKTNDREFDENWKEDLKTILDFVPKEVQDQYRDICFAEFYGKIFPGIQLGPFDVDTSLCENIQKGYVTMAQKCYRDGRNTLARLIYWYGTPHDDLKTAFSFLPVNSKIFSYEEGCRKGYNKIPSSIQNKIDKRINLSANDKLIVEGLKELKRERALPKKQRVLWLKATQDEDSIEEEEDETEVEYETEDEDKTEDEDEYSYGLQMADPSTDSLLIPFTHSSIPDPRGLYCKLKAEYGEVDCWTCTLCRYDFRYSVQLVSHVQTSKHMDALNMPNPHSSTPNADGDRLAHRLLREVSTCSSAHEMTKAGKNHSQGDERLTVGNETEPTNAIQNPTARILGNSFIDMTNDIEPVEEAETQVHTNSSRNISEPAENGNAQAHARSSQDGKNGIEREKEAKTQVPTSNTREITLEDKPSSDGKTENEPHWMDRMNEIELENEAETQVPANLSDHMPLRAENGNVPTPEALGLFPQGEMVETELKKEVQTQVTANPTANSTRSTSEWLTANDLVEEETCFEEHRARAGKYKCFRNFNLLYDPTKALQKEDGMVEDDDMDTSSDDDDTQLRKRFKPSNDR